jgi:adenylate cyclase
VTVLFAASVVELAQTITARASGTPFFAEEIVRELADRDVLQGNPGSYVSTAEAADVSVPATLQATIAARIDRLGALATSLSFEGHMEWAEAMS